MMCNDDPETVAVECTVLLESEKAFLLREVSEDREAWFPKSEIAFSHRNIKTGKATAEIPVWLLEKKGW